jgi:SNF2 family DNA or RNA helicase
MSLRSGAGVDGLQKRARVGIFGELDWSPTVHEQAIGRLARDGIEDPPVIYFLNSANGTDPLILEKLQIKRQQQEPMLSKDGQMFAPAAQDPNRARRLAERILGITPEEQEPAA